MATISPTVSATNDSRHKPFIVILWETFTENDSIDSLEVVDYTKLVSSGGVITDMIVQVVGTFGGGTITIQQSVDGTNWVTAKDPNDTDITFTSTGAKAIRDDFRYFRATQSGGTSQDVDIYLQINMARF